jgi:hypothetical protein
MNWIKYSQNGKVGGVNLNMVLELVTDHSITMDDEKCQVVAVLSNSARIPISDILINKEAEAMIDCIVNNVGQYVETDPNRQPFVGVA